MKIGDRVKLSDQGLRTFPRSRINEPLAAERRGTITNDGDNRSGKKLSAGCVRVKWDHFKVTKTIATCFIEPLAKKPEPETTWHETGNVAREK